MTVNLDNYVEVHVRIKAFHEKHPEGSLQGTYTVETIGDATGIVYIAKAYRTPNDVRPGIGMAWEPVPGLTPYTKGSELMNAETSAWGRALAALGFEVHRGIASANEVRARSNGADTAPPASSKQKGLITRRCNELAISDELKAKLFEWAGGEPFTIPKASKLIGALKDAKDHAEVLKIVDGEQSLDDLPADVPPVEPEIEEPALQ